MRHLKRNRVFNYHLLLAASVFLLFFAACGGKGSKKPDDPDVPVPPPPPPPVVVSITISPTAATIKAGDSIPLTVTPQNTGFTVSASEGSFTTSGNIVTYTPPSSKGEYELTVTASSDTTKRATALISVFEIDDIDIPEAVHTELYGINNHGLMIGESVDGYNNRTAFLRTGDDYIPIGPSGVVGNVYVFGINDDGHVLGYADDYGYFLRTGSLYQPVGNYPDAEFTNYTDINNSGYLTGYVTDVVGYSRGFIRIGDDFSFVDHPEAASSCAYYECGTWLYGINNSGQAVGEYMGSDGRYRSFIKDGDDYIPLAPSVEPGVLFSVHVNGINDSGVAVGYFLDSSGYSRGFMSDGVDFEEFIHPAASSYGTDRGTYLEGINDSGQVVGMFYDGEKARGFSINF